MVMSLMIKSLICLQGFLRAKFVICLTFSERGDLITGDSNGTIYIWGEGGNRITNYVKHAHDVLLSLLFILLSKRVKMSLIRSHGNKFGLSPQ